jgi:C2H2-type zinc finger
LLRAQTAHCLVQAQRILLVTKLWSRRILYCLMAEKMRISALLSDDDSAQCFQNSSSERGQLSAVGRPANRRPDRTYTCRTCQRQYKDEASLHGHIVMHTSVHSSKGTGRPASPTAPNSQRTMHASADAAAPSSPSPTRVGSSQLARPPHSSTSRWPPATTDAGASQSNCCSACNLTFGSEAELRRHRSRHHATKSYAFICDQCDLSFHLKNQLEAHVVTVHDKVRPYECDICGLAFGLKWNR